MPAAGAVPATDRSEDLIIAEAMNSLAQMYTVNVAVILPWTWRVILASFNRVLCRFHFICSSILQDRTFPALSSHFGARLRESASKRLMPGLRDEALINYRTFTRPALYSNRIFTITAGSMINGEKYNTLLVETKMSRPQMFFARRVSDAETRSVDLLISRLRIDKSAAGRLLSSVRCK